MSDVGAFAVDPAIAAVFRKEDAFSSGGEDAVIGGAGDDFPALVDVAALDRDGWDRLIVVSAGIPDGQADAPSPAPWVMVMVEGKPVAPSPADADGDRRKAADGACLHLAFSDFGKTVLEGEKLVIVCHEGDGAVRSGIAVAVDGLDTGETFREGGQHSFELRLRGDVSFGIDESPELAVA